MMRFVGLVTLATAATLIASTASAEAAAAATPKPAQEATIASRVGNQATALGNVLNVFASEAGGDWKAYDALTGVTWSFAKPSEYASGRFQLSGDLLLTGFGMTRLPNGKAGSDYTTIEDNEGKSGLTLTGDARHVQMLSVRKFYLSDDYQHILQDQFGAKDQVIPVAQHCSSDEDFASNPAFFEIELRNGKKAYVEAFQEEGGKFAPSYTVFDFMREKPVGRIRKLKCLVAGTARVSLRQVAEGRSGQSGVGPETSEPPATAALSQNRIDTIVAEVMDQQYGTSRDPAGQCWEYTYSDGDVETDYCMQPAKADVIRTAKGVAIYLRASNTPNAEEGYEAVTPGLMGAFQVAVGGDGQWRYVAKSPALPFGTMGYCGCDKATFVRLGQELYGWMFTSGGTWQGVTVANYEIVAPRGDVFTDVSDVPEIREDDQTASYSVEVVDDGSDIFPLKVTRMVSGHSDGERMVPFNRVAWAYRMPQSL